MDSNKAFLNYINTIYSSLNSEQSVASNLREVNMNSIETNGLPTHRKGNEEWKYSNLRRMTELEYKDDSSVDNVLNKKISPLNIDGFSILNIVNGELIDSNLKDTTIKVKNLLSGNLTKQDISKFDSTMEGVNEELAQLNSAICKDPIHIDINNNDSKSNLIINIININNGDKYILNSPKIFVNIDENSNVEIIENHIGESGSLYASNSVLEIILNKKAKLVHYRVLEDTDESTNIPDKSNKSIDTKVNKVN